MESSQFPVASGADTDIIKSSENKSEHVSFYNFELEL